MPTLSSNKPRVIITMGDPSGIGPEVVDKSISDKSISGVADITVIGKPSADKDPASCAKAAIGYIDEAIELIKNKKADALVTAPVNKSSIRSAGYKDFQGHTEYLAQKFGVKDFCMMFVGKKLKISLVTRHVALKNVPSAITADSIYSTIILTAQYLEKYFKVKDPKIAVAGLNPHAGDGGSFGDEELRIISPAIKKAASSVKNIYGPVSADAVFYKALKGDYDAVVALYHDQALAPFKTLYFNDGVNLTLGLPFVRTSPDHGTALDIAGKGIADPSSMKEAIVLAAKLCRKI